MGRAIIYIFLRTYRVVHPLEGFAFAQGRWGGTD
jgi:hypothetical protein